MRTDLDNDVGILKDMYVPNANPRSEMRLPTRVVLPRSRQRSYASGRSVMEAEVNSRAERAAASLRDRSGAVVTVRRTDQGEQCNKGKKTVGHNVQQTDS